MGGSAPPTLHFRGSASDPEFVARLFAFNHNISAQKPQRSSKTSSCPIESMKSGLGHGLNFTLKFLAKCQ